MTSERELIRKWRLHVFEPNEERVRQLARTFPDNRSIVISFEQCGTDYGFTAPLLNDPDSTFAAARQALEEFVEKDLDGVETGVDVDANDVIFFRLTDVPASVRYELGELGAAHIGRLVVVEATVEAVSPRHPRIITAAFRCRRCGGRTARTQRYHRLRRPTYCDGCASSSSFVLEPQQCTYVDSQVLTLRHDELSWPGVIEHDLVGTVLAGDEVEIVAIPRARSDGETTRSSLELDVVNVTTEQDRSKAESSSRLEGALSDNRVTQLDDETISDSNDRNYRDSERSANSMNERMPSFTTGGSPRHPSQ